MAYSPGAARALVTTTGRDYPGGTKPAVPVPPSIPSPAPSWQVLYSPPAGASCRTPLLPSSCPTPAPWMVAPDLPATGRRVRRTDILIVNSPAKTASTPRFRVLLTIISRIPGSFVSAPPTHPDPERLIPPRSAPHHGRARAVGVVSGPPLASRPETTRCKSTPATDRRSDTHRRESTAPGAPGHRASPNHPTGNERAFRGRGPPRRAPVPKTRAWGVFLARQAHRWRHSAPEWGVLVARARGQKVGKLSRRNRALFPSHVPWCVCPSRPDGWEYPGWWGCGVLLSWCGVWDVRECGMGARGDVGCG